MAGANTTAAGHRAYPVSLVEVSQSFTIEDPYEDASAGCDALCHQKQLTVRREFVPMDEQVTVTGLGRL